MSVADPPVTFGSDGLIPAVITEARSGDVLMIGFMNREALDTTRDTGLVHFWSRSRSELWKKGGTSGHVQEVVEIRVNCDQNALQIDVRQAGAVCHDGYDTCFYRRLTDDNTLEIVRERQFDPADVYGPDSSLPALTRRWWGAYSWLRDHDLSADSSTSARLHGDGTELGARAADELRELAGVIDGSHVHTDQRADLVLEATQVCYWVAVAAIQAGVSWDAVRPDRALAQAAGEDYPHPASLILLLQHQADVWKDASPFADLAALAHETLAFVVAAIAIRDIDPREILTADLQDLRSRPYLAEYFASIP